MNCKHIQELLPLYVGRDLEEKRAQLVTSHVQSCVECASSADEYRESRQLLQQFAPPPFSDAIYTGIRQRVLREIGRESPESIGLTLPGFVASLFRPSLRWAFATALLLGVSVFAFYFVANRRNNQQQITGTGRAVDRTARDKQANAPSQGNELSASASPAGESNNGSSTASTGGNTGADTTAGSLGTHESPRRKSSVPAINRPTSHTVNVAVNTPDSRSIGARPSPESNNLAEPDTIPARNAATSEKTLRVEMQTNNPNIRIIWFSPQRPKQSSPGKSTKAIQEVRSYA